MDTYLLFIIVMVLGGILWVLESILSNIKKQRVQTEKTNMILKDIEYLMRIKQ